jgi:hypothetical protein
MTDPLEERPDQPFHFKSDIIWCDFPFYSKYHGCIVLVDNVTQKAYIISYSTLHIYKNMLAERDNIFGQNGNQYTILCYKISDN